MKTLILATLMSISLTQAAWQPADDTINFKCGDGLNNFEFTTYYNDQAPSLELAYEISVTQFPFIGAEIQPKSQIIPGCEKTLVSFSQNGMSGEIYFECAADGDAGYGTIKVDFMTAKATATINFPEGQSTLFTPFPDDTTFTLPCLL